jgi:hypothetical protein
MSYNDNDLPRTKVVMRGKMLIAWLPEATPPVLWRWAMNDVSGGFGLRPVDDRVELLRLDSGVNPQVVASFSSASSAERALSRLSRATLSYKTPLKKALKVLGVIFLLILMISLVRTWQQYAAISSMEQFQAMNAGRMPATRTAQAPTPPLMLPGQAPPSAPSNELPMGVPTDVDKHYK